MMKRVVGIGGVFFKAKDPKALSQWYDEHLGLPKMGEGYFLFRWRREDDPERREATAWSTFANDTTYFEPSKSPFMVNYIVDDLDAVLAALRAEGVTVDDKVQDEGYGRFGWAMDPEGNRIELWEPKKPNS
jgi:catechol 2,3-dioxygenase-like lactoylglutathione lyase family enzyme